MGCVGCKKTINLEVIMIPHILKNAWNWLAVRDRT